MNSKTTYSWQAKGPPTPGLSPTSAESESSLEVANMEGELLERLLYI